MSRLFSLALICFICIATKAHATPITYDLVDFGTGVTGTITTDGVLGALTEFDLVSWQLAAFGLGDYVSSESSRNPSVSVQNLMATSTELWLPWNPVGGIKFADQQEGVNRPATSGWSVATQGDNPKSYTFNGGATLIAGSGPDLVIATVAPEPSTLIFAALGGLALLLRGCRRRNVAPALIVLAVFATDARAQVTMAWSDVGNPGNSPDTTGYGAVANAYRIATYDVTNSQYVDFLNTVDPTGQNQLQLWNSNMGQFGGISFDASDSNGSKFIVIAGDGNHPVNFVTWYSAIRFTNWLDNGQTPGTTETGAYTLVGATPVPSNADSIMRNANATIFLPSEDEWYKAAYYNPATSSYFQFPTSSNTVPIATGPTTTPNSANYNNPLGSPTDVGAYTGTTSPYGAFDMGGNVFQWNEALLDGEFRGIRGGSFQSPLNPNQLQSSFRDDGFLGSSEQAGFGFRVASVPEQSTMVLSSVGALALLAFQWRRAVAIAGMSEVPQRRR
jgi:sulfatase modifying factor 1